MSLIESSLIRKNELEILEKILIVYCLLIFLLENILINTLKRIHLKKLLSAFCTRYKHLDKANISPNLAV
jgi:hypothetical protein